MSGADGRRISPRDGRCARARWTGAGGPAVVALALAWLVLAAVGCRGAPATTAPEAASAATTRLAPSEPSASTAGEPATPVQIALAATDLAVGHERFAFAILTPSGDLVQHAAATVTFLKLDAETATPITTTRATFYPARLEAAGLYVARTTFDTPGDWGAEIDATLDDGSAILPQRVRFQVQVTPSAVGTGGPPPPTANRTLATEPDIARLTSDPSPDPDFYRLTVDEAAASGRPTVIVFATPGHCTSRVCGPVLDEVKAVKAATGDAVNYLHIDVYEQFEPLVLSETMTAWGLKTEPWVYVLAADGTVAERLEGSVTAAELGPIVAGLIDAGSP